MLCAAFHSGLERRPMFPKGMGTPIRAAMDGAKSICGMLPSAGQLTLLCMLAPAPASGATAACLYGIASGVQQDSNFTTHGDGL